MKHLIRTSVFLVLFFAFALTSYSQPLFGNRRFTKMDSLRGSITPGRAWWDVVSYNLQVTPDYRSKTIRGWNQITFDVQTDGRNRPMQIDLQPPMVIDSIIFNKKKVKGFKRYGTAYLIDFGDYKFSTTRNLVTKDKPVTLPTITVYFHGKPREAVNPPWDGGWIWGKDAKGRPWMTVACQGLGASVWYPCKDHQSDEPDKGALIQIRVPDSLVAVGNGRLYAKNSQGDGSTLYTWQVKNPINNYNIVPYIGKYVTWSDSYVGEKGKLSLDYWVLDYNLENSKRQFNQDVKPMLKTFESWFGPYPFYEDGFKLVETPHLGMEHQSAIAYGNHYMNGYRGTDRSGTGWGTKWDYIIIHEAGHEWFGNNITTKDLADWWVHEGFTTYSEVLYVEAFYGKKAADAYAIGLRQHISNSEPMIGPYGVNKEGSSDAYDKGVSFIHTLRQIIEDDTLFRKILRGLNREFYHKTVDSRDVENYISRMSGKDLSKIFDQYLRTTRIPQFEYRITNDRLTYRWSNCIKGFDMPVRLSGTGTWLRPTADWKSTTMTSDMKGKPEVDPTFYIKVVEVD